MRVLVTRGGGEAAPEIPPASVVIAEPLRSTARELLPATRLGDAAVGDGRPGPVTRALHAAFRAHADAVARGVNSGPPEGGAPR